MNKILISALAALAVTVALLWWQLDSKTEQLGSVRSELKQEEARTKSLRETMRLQRELTADAEALDARTTQELTDAQAENDRLAAAVAAGTQRLRIKANCPRVPETTGTTSMDDAGTAELAPSARQDYHAHRRQITVTEKALAGLQEYVALVCLRGEAQ